MLDLKDRPGKSDCRTEDARAGESLLGWVPCQMVFEGAAEAWDGNSPRILLVCLQFLTREPGRR